MLRLALVALLLALAVFGVAKVVAPEDGESRAPSPERRAAGAVTRALRLTLPQERKARCRRAPRRADSERRFACGWRASRRLSPNRARVCRGRALVIPSAEKRVRVRRGPCRLRVQALDPRFGFHDNSVAGQRASAEQVARLAEGTGAGLYRFLVDWRSAEPQRDVYDLRMPDQVYRALVARGIRPVLLLAWAPNWSWNRLVVCNHPSCHFPPSRANDHEWREFVALMARRYPKAAGIEIWNEPNETTGWNPAPDVGRYVELLRQAYRAVKEVDPSMPVISGGLSHRKQSDAGGLAIEEFFERLFEAGAADYMDGVGMHPYAPVDGLDRLTEPLELIRELRPRDLPIWVTEVGVSTTPGPITGTEQEQADAVATAYRVFRDQPDVAGVLIHTLIDPYDDPAIPNAGFGVLRGDLSEKPAYCTLALETGARSSCP